MSLITVSGLTFSYDGSFDTIFENVSFRFDTDWKLGFTGRNGRGKTTFLSLLQGKYEYRGTISSSVEFDYFPQEIPDRSLPVKAVIGSLIGAYEDWKLEREFSLLLLSGDIGDRLFDTLSGGEQTKVLLAALFLKSDRFLLIDEPTNHLDSEGRRVVSSYLEKKKGFLLVSHDRAFLDGCIDHILSINRNNIDIQKGNFASWQQNKDRQDCFELAENEKRKAEIRELEIAARRTANWSDKVERTKNGVKNSGVKPDKGYIGHKAAKMMRRSKNIEARQEKAIELKSSLLKNIETADRISIAPLTYHRDKLFELTDFSVYYLPGIPVHPPLSFSLRQGERIALNGKNGSGKSSLLKCLTGEAISYTGTLRMESGLLISYVPQDTSFLRGGLREFAVQSKIDETLFKAILRKLDFPRTQFEKDMADFSAGQKKKVVLAKSLCERAHLYLWDEPLNYVDIISRIQIEELLRRCRPTMLFIEHDSAFTAAVATEQIEL